VEQVAVDEVEHFFPHSDQFVLAHALQLSPPLYIVDLALPYAEQLLFFLLLSVALGKHA